jgi:hypothetical protein
LEQGNKPTLTRSYFSRRSRCYRFIWFYNEELQNCQKEKDQSIKTLVHILVFFFFFSTSATGTILREKDSNSSGSLQQFRKRVESLGQWFSVGKVGVQQLPTLQRKDSARGWEWLWIGKKKKAKRFSFQLTHTTHRPVSWHHSSQERRPCQITNRR